MITFCERWKMTHYLIGKSGGGVVLMQAIIFLPLVFLESLEPLYCNVFTILSVAPVLSTDM